MGRSGTGQVAKLNPGQIGNPMWGLCCGGDGHARQPVQTADVVFKLISAHACWPQIFAIFFQRIALTNVLIFGHAIAA